MMERKALRGAGQIYFGDSLNDGEGMRKGRDFFQSLSEECYKNLTNYWQAVDKTDHIFTYSEKQSPSYLMPALASLSEGAAICEMPLNRQKTDNGGYLDYWSHYRGVPIAIEVKHSWYNLTGEGMTRTFKYWQQAHKQLEDANGQNISDGNPFLCVNMMVIPFESRHKPEKNIKQAIQNEDYHTYIMGELAQNKHKGGKDRVPEPNIWSYWVLPEKMAYLNYEDRNGLKNKHFYPAVAMYGHLEMRKGN